MENGGSPRKTEGGPAPDWLKCLRSRLRTLPELSERHADLVASVQERTHVPLQVLEIAYDVARESGLDPGLALEIVACGVCVVELEEPLPVADQAHSLNPPDWVAPPLVTNEV